MNYLRTMRMLGLALPTLAQHRACLYLERHGFRFCIDFGIQNAAEKARAYRLGCERRTR